jgi:hypothetical protein
MVSLPSFSGWLASKDILFQSNFAAFMKLSPIFLILYGYMLCKNVLGMTQELSFMIPALAGIMVFGAFISWDFGNRNASNSYLPTNMTLTWSPSKVVEEICTIVDYIPLIEDAVTRTFNYAVRFDMELLDENDNKFQNAIFMSHYPIDKTFRRIPGQFIAFRGSVFEGMAARVVATYMNEYNDLISIKAEDMRMGTFKVFHVKWCPEDSKKDQIKNGLYKEETLENTVGIPQIKEAVQLEIDRKATRLGMMYKESKEELGMFAEAYKDSKTRGYRGMNRLLDDEERIKQERTGTITRLLRDPKVRIIVALGVGLLALYVGRYYKVI